MTNHRAGKTNTRNPRHWCEGKAEKKSTARLLRRMARELTQGLRRGGGE